MAKPDPTKNPEFQKVVQHFLTTPHRPHDEMKLGKPRGKTKKSAVRARRKAKAR
jgi:hypothetical protein